MADSFSKREKEKKKAQKKKEKAARKEARQNDEKGSTLDDMIAYVDADGNIVDTPPDEQDKKEEINAEDIVIGIPPKEESDGPDIYEGMVTFFNDEKGYGFIKDKNGRDSYFVHINNCSFDIKEGNKVSFEVEKGDKGLVAVRVSMAQ